MKSVPSRWRSAGWCSALEPGPPLSGQTAGQFAGSVQSAESNANSTQYNPSNSHLAKPGGNMYANYAIDLRTNPAYV